MLINIQLKQLHLKEVQHQLVKLQIQHNKSNYKLEIVHSQNKKLKVKIQVQDK